MRPSVVKHSRQCTCSEIDAPSEGYIQGQPGSARPDRLQIVYVLLCDRDGRPIAVEVFEGDFGDPSTVSAQISKLKQRFDLKHVYWSATAA